MYFILLKNIKLFNEREACVEELCWMKPHDYVKLQLALVGRSDLQNRELWVKHINTVIPCDALVRELLMHASKTIFSSGTNLKCSQYHRHTISEETIWVQRSANIFF